MTYNRIAVVESVLRVVVGALILWACGSPNWAIVFFVLVSVRVRVIYVRSAGRKESAWPER